MAGPSQDNASTIKSQFKTFATKADGNEATCKDISRWMQDSGVFKGSKTCTSQNLDIAFSVVKPKGKNTVTVKDIGALIGRISKQYANDHHMSEDDAAVELTDMLSSSQKAAHWATKTSKTGGVEKMTDASQYTGSHKERFDESGKGKGLDGRLELVSDAGYVNNYKGEGTYDEQHEKP